MNSKNQTKQIQNLVESENIFRTLVDQSLLGIYLVQNDKFIYANERFSEILEHTVEEMLNWEPNEFTKFIHPHDLEFVREQGRKKQIGEDGYLTHYIARLIPKPDKIKFIEIFSKSVNIGGKPADFVTVIDITDRIQEERKLSESEEKFRIITENSPNIITFLNVDGTIRYINSAIDHTIEELIGTYAFDYIPDKFKKIAEDCLQRVIKTGKHDKYFIDYVAPGGEIRIYETIISPVMRVGEVNYLILNSSNITDLRNKTEEIKLQNQIMANMSEGVILVGLEDGIIYYTNHAFEEMFGYDPGEMIGKNISIVNAPTDKTPKETREDIMRILIETGEWQGEIKNIKKDGTLFWCYANVSTFDHPDYGKVIISVHTDITERKKSEQKLKNSELKLKESNQILENIFSTTHFQLVLLDKNFNFLRVNEAYAQTCGYPKNFFIGKNYFDLYPGNEVQQIFQRVVDTKERFSILARPFVFPDQPERGVTYWDWTLKTILDNNNEIQGLVFSLNEVTDQINAEMKMKESEGKFRAIFEQAADSILLINSKNANIEEFNESACKNLGYTRDEFKNLNLSDIEIIESPDEIQKHMNKLKEDGKDTFETKHITKKGKIRNILVNAKYVKIGETDFILSMFSDVTELKQTQEKLARELKVKSFMAELSSYLIKKTDSIEDIATFVLEITKNLTKSEQGYVGIIDEENGDLISYTINEMMESCLIDEKIKKIRFPKGPDGLYPALWGYSLNKQKSFFTNTAQNHSSSKGTPKGHIPINNYLSVPVISAGQLLGQIALTNKIDGYKSKDIEVIRRISDLFAVYLQQKRSDEKISRLAKFPEENPNPVLRISKEGIIIYNNKASEPILNAWGYINGLPISNTWHQYILKAISLKIPQFGELDHDGKTYSLTFSPVIDTDFVNVYGLEITDRKNAEKIKNRVLYNLKERMKELRCLYSLEKIMEEKNGIEEVLSEFVGHIPPAWQFPELTCAKIVINEKEFISENFKETEYVLSDPIIANNIRIGSIAVYYLEKVPGFENGPFLQEEEDLIKALSDRLGNFVEQKDAESQIKKNLLEKEILLQEIHHRVKNNMQIISSLLKLQGKKVKNSQVRRILEECDNRIKVISFIHETIYKSKDFSEINFSEYVENLTKNLYLSYGVDSKQIIFILESDKMMLELSIAIPCGLIINELVSNALKYAFPEEKGYIKVGMKKIEGGKIKISIQDNGIGLPQDFNMNKLNTMGLNLVKNLTEQQLRGQFTINSVKGTNVELTFRINTIYE